MSVTLTEIRSYLYGQFEHPCAFIPVQNISSSGSPQDCQKLEIHCTPKHGSWLDIAEIELNVMTRQCLSRRIADIVLLRQELAAWEGNRNEHTACIQWQFTTDNARTKLVSLYPKFDVVVKIIRLSINGQHTSTCTSVSRSIISIHSSCLTSFSPYTTIGTGNPTALHWHKAHSIRTASCFFTPYHHP